MKFISKRLLNMKLSKTLAMSNKARRFKKKKCKIINLSIGEPDFYPPKYILNYAKKAIDNGYHYYTPISGDLELKKKICEKFIRDNNIYYNTSQILISNGAKQSIINIFLSILNPGDEIIIPAPYWVSYYEMAKLCEAFPKIIYTTFNTNFKITAKQLKKSITYKTKAFIFNNPCNPTGCIYTKKEIKSLINILKKYPNIIIISDEIYEYINYFGKHISIASFSEVYKQTITINGISKAFSMTGWRIGYMGGPKWIIKSCEKIQGQITSGANSIAQRAAINALKLNKKYIEYIIEELKKRRNLALKLSYNIPGLKFITPMGAFYLFEDISNFLKKKYLGIKINNSNELANFLLKKAHVATVSGSAFGYPNGLRISYACSRKKLIQAFLRIKKILCKG